jgi:hypothetical protein
MRAVDLAWTVVYPFQFQKLDHLGLGEIFNQELPQLPFTFVMERVVMVYLPPIRIWIILQPIEHISADTEDVSSMRMTSTSGGLPIVSTSTEYRRDR